MQSPPDDLKNILSPNEQVELYIKQKIYHPKINVDSIVLTNLRIILRQPHALGLKKNYTDFNYQDIANVVLDKGIMRSTVKCTLRFGGVPLALNDLPNSDAEKAYGIIIQNLGRFQASYSGGPTGPPYQHQVPPAGTGSASSYCPKCGAPLTTGQKFCGSCGAAI